MAINARSAPPQPSLYMLGVDAHRLPIQQRERFALCANRKARLHTSLLAMQAAGTLTEFALLSTCNRTEVYAVTSKAVHTQTVLQHWAQACEVPTETLQPHVCTHTGARAAQHLFMVAAGLHSQLLGETEILGQLKAAYTQAKAEKTAGALLHRCFQKSFQAAKWVRTHTHIAKGHVSLGSITAQLAGHIWGERPAENPNFNVTLVGAGEMGGQILRALHSRKVCGNTPSIVTRSAARAQELAESLGAATTATIYPANELSTAAAQADIIICASSAEGYLLNQLPAARLKAARGSRPLLLVDVGVPRDINPALAKNASVFLYDLDDIGNIAQRHLTKREAARDECTAYLTTRAQGTWEHIVKSHATQAENKASHRASTLPLSA